MSQENVEEQNVKFVLDGYARFNAGEKEAGLWFFAPEAEYPRRPRGSRFHAKAAVGSSAIRLLPARYRVGDVAGERRCCAAHVRSV